MEIKTLSGKTINNATLHYYPNDKHGITAAVYMRHDSKILCRFVMRDPEAFQAYMVRQGWQDLPVKMYTHRGE